MCHWLSLAVSVSPSLAYFTKLEMVKTTAGFALSELGERERSLKIREAGKQSETGRKK